MIDDNLEDKKPLIVSGLKIILQDPNLKVSIDAGVCVCVYVDYNFFSQVRKMFNQVVIAMASHGYLELEGGQLMVEFVVKQCALDTEDKTLAKLSGDGITPTSLRDMSDKTLQLITTTIDHMEKVLWPYLLEFSLPLEYTASVGIVCKCVTDIAVKKKSRNDEDFILNFEELGISDTAVVCYNNYYDISS